MELKFKKLYEGVKKPSKAYAGDAGFDLYTHSVVRHPVNRLLEIRTGIAVEIPEGHAGLLIERSSTHKLGLKLANTVGVIDSGYRGELVAFLRMENFRAIEENKLKRLVQLVIVPIPHLELKECDELSVSNRDVGGFGSSG